MAKKVRSIHAAMLRVSRVEDKALESAGFSHYEGKPPRLQFHDEEFEIGPTKANVEFLMSTYKK